MKGPPKLTPDSVLEEFMRPYVFQVFTRLSREKQSINLGQGFPNWGVPDFVQAALERVVDQRISSDNFSFGCANLLAALCEEYRADFGRPLDPFKNVAVSTGGIAVLSEVTSSLTPADEVLIIEPFFSYYEPIVRFFRAKLRFVKLLPGKEGRFALDTAAVRAAVTGATKWVFLNSPHNPTGKVFSMEEYAFFGQLARDFPQLRFLSDEVYEKICLDADSLPRVANVEGLWDKTLSVFSGGKTFSCTGWRVGWAVGPEPLIARLKRTQHCTNTHPSAVVQEALALALPIARQPYRGFASYYLFLRARFRENARILQAALADSGLGFRVFPPEGGYFLTADISESILQMPVWYVFSEEARQTRPHLKTQRLPSLRDYHHFEGAAPSALDPKAQTSLPTTPSAAT